jgi:hypothetical protein
MRSSTGRVKFVRRLFVGVMAALAALVVLTGCGGSSSSSSTPGATTASVASAADGPLCDPTPCQITRAEFAAKLAYLCLRGKAELMQADTSFEHATKASDYTKAAAAMESALREFPPYQNTILGLEPAPAQDQAAYTRYVDLTRRIYLLSERIVSARVARDTPQVIHLSQLVKEDLPTRARAAVDLGMKHCGR